MSAHTRYYPRMDAVDFRSGERKCTGVFYRLSAVWPRSSSVDEGVSTRSCSRACVRSTFSDEGIPVRQFLDSDNDFQAIVGWSTYCWGLAPFFLAPVPILGAGQASRQIGRLRACRYQVCRLERRRERNGRSTFPDGHCYPVRVRQEGEPRYTMIVDSLEAQGKATGRSDLGHFMRAECCNEWSKF